jgi:hypothetical protein
MSTARPAAGAFTVTAAAPVLTLDAERRAAAEFSVSQGLGRDVRVTVRPVPIPPTPPQWLELVGPIERTLTATAAVPVSVSVAVPPEAAPGTYSFRLDVASIALPDDEWGRSEPVSVDVAAPPVVVPKPVPRPLQWRTIAIGAAVLGGLVVVAVAIALLTRRPDPISLPAVNGLPVAVARTSLETLCDDPSPCLAVSQVEQTTSIAPAGTVLGTLPPAGTEVLPGSDVRLVVAREGPIFDPDLPFRTLRPWIELPQPFPAATPPTPLP